MFKKVACIVAISMLLTIPVYAHLTGAFVNFLAIVYDDTTISKLQEELEQTKLEIEQLEPLVKHAENEFKEDQQVAVEQLQFYSEMGLDTWFALIQQGTDVVDMLGNQWVIEHKIADYLQQLNELYSQYQQLLQNQNTLKGHEQLLYAIEKNLHAREVYLADTAELELETIANYLDIDWTAEVEAHIIADLQHDHDIVSAWLLDWVTINDAGYQLQEQWLNEQSNAKYYFRNDHVYVEYELQYAHVLVLGQVLQNEEGTAAELVYEAGFYNGFYLPEELLLELPGIELNYDSLRTLDNITEPYVIQRDGSLQLYSK